MSVQIVQAARASTPYRWARFWAWMLDQGFGPEEIQTMIENGVEPSISNAVGLTLDDTVVYPGLPDPEHLPDDINGVQPSFTLIGGPR